MNELNNARIKSMSYAVFYDYEVVDERQGIWKGKLVLDADARTDDKVMYFLRKYDRKDNDVDRMLQGEFEFIDTNILGVKFLLVPKDKVLFAYEPSTIIIRPPIKIAKKMGGL